MYQHGALISRVVSEVEQAKPVSLNANDPDPLYRNAFVYLNGPLSSSVFLLLRCLVLESSNERVFLADVGSNNTTTAAAGVDGRGGVRSPQVTHRNARTYEFDSSEQN